MGAADTATLTWREATRRALYGDGGFYRRTAGPAAHFRTSVHASPLFAEAVLALAREAELTTVIDVGSGRGELLTRLHRLDPGLRLIGVEVADRPPELPVGIDWAPTIPAGTGGLLVANEWLDNVPVDVAVRDGTDVRLVLVDPSTGAESLGGPPTAMDAEWLDLWWPVPEDGQRAEIGWPRDEAWAEAIELLGTGVAVAVDYGHLGAERPRGGTLTGYRVGRQVPPVPDGSCDLTAHVALDACAEAGRQAGASGTALTSQRDALSALGLTAGPPSHELARDDPSAYVEGLARVSQLAELRERGGLGDFAWLVQAVGTDLPTALTGEQGQL